MTTVQCPPHWYVLNPQSEGECKYCGKPYIKQVHNYDKRNFNLSVPKKGE